MSGLPPTAFDVGIIGAGPAGLMAAEVIAAAGLAVTVVDASRSAARKFLLAGKGGLNLTHSEPIEKFLSRYHGGGPGSADAVARWLAGFGPQALRDWCTALGIETFVGSSGRVFPKEMKAAPLLRAWLHRLRGQGVRFVMRHRWCGWSPAGQPVFEHEGERVFLTHRPRAWLLALGGGSWPQLGSDGGWVALLRQRGVVVTDLCPANCGYAVAVADEQGLWRDGWSDYLREKFAGSALKNVAASVGDWQQAGELLLTHDGIEGNLVYAAGSRLREAMQRDGQATLWLNLLPAHPKEKILRETTHPRGSRSWASHLKSRLGLDGAKLALLHEVLPKADWHDARRVADAIHALPLRLTRPRPLAEAISSAGGICFSALSPEMELTALPGFYCAGEMLDWDAPTGGYLLSACLAGGRHVGRRIVENLAPSPARSPR